MCFCRSLTKESLSLPLLRMLPNSEYKSYECGYKSKISYGLVACICKVAKSWPSISLRNSPMLAHQGTSLFLRSWLKKPSCELTAMVPRLVYWSCLSYFLSSFEIVSRRNDKAPLLSSFYLGSGILARFLCSLNELHARHSTSLAFFPGS